MTRMPGALARPLGSARYAPMLPSGPEIVMSGIASLPAAWRGLMMRAGRHDSRSARALSRQGERQLARSGGRQPGAFELEQEALGGDAALAGIAAHPPAGGEHAVARDDDRDGVAAAGAADRPRDAVEAGGELAIGPGAAARYGQHLAPHRLLEGRARRRQRQVESVQLAIEKSIELLCGGQQQRRAVFGGRSAPIERDDGAVALGD